MAAHDRLAIHEFIHRYWFHYDEGLIDVLSGMTSQDCELRSRTERGDHPYEEFIASHSQGHVAAMEWTKQHRQFSPYPLRHQASNIFVAAERGEEVDVVSYLFVTQIVDRTPSMLSTGIVTWTLRRGDGGTYQLVNQDVVLDSIESAAFETIPEVSGRIERW
jgi:SnoaL-like domain